jgi:hypothetical protein
MININITKPDPCEGVEAVVCARTGLKLGGSPFIELLLAGLAVPIASEAVSLVFEEAKASVQRLVEEKEERQELLRGSFSELRNCEFVIPKFPGTDQIAANGALSDIAVAFELTKTIRALVGENLVTEDIRVDKKSLKIEDIKVDKKSKYAPTPLKNHVYIGRCNPYNEWILGLREKVPTETPKIIRQPWLDNMPYKVVQVNGQCSIVKMEDEQVKELYQPAYNCDLGRYDRDYLMIFKIPSVFEEAQGHYDFGILGIHREGTLGTLLAMKDTKFLEGIRDASSTTGFFQAIAEIDVGERPKEKHGQIWDKLSRFIAKVITWEDFDKISIIEPDSIRLIRAVSIPLK